MYNGKTLCFNQYSWARAISQDSFLGNIRHQATKAPHKFKHQTLTLNTNNKHKETIDSTTVLPTKSDSDSMFCIQSYRDFPFRVG